MISAQTMAVLNHFIDSVKSGKGKASLVLLTYNRWEWTEMTLNSVFSNTFFPHDLIVVDNHSTDGTVEKLKQLYCSHKIATLILLPRNYGIYAGFNIGLKYGDYNSWLAVLSNDVQVSPYWLSALCYVAFRLKAVVGTPTEPKLRQWIAGRKIGNVGGLQVVETSWATNPPVMTKETFQKIGYFREDIDKGELSFYAIGDTEYSERAKKLGVGTYYVLDLECFHIPDMLAQQQGKVHPQVEREKYPDYRKWKDDVGGVKRPKWFKGEYARWTRYETRYDKSWIEQYLWKG